MPFLATHGMYIVTVHTAMPQSPAPSQLSLLCPIPCPRSVSGNSWSLFPLSVWDLDPIAGFRW